MSFAAWLQEFLNLVIIVLIFLIVIEGFKTIPRTIKFFGLINKIDNMIEFSKKTIIEKRAALLNSVSKEEVEEFFKKSSIEKQGSLLAIDDTLLDFDKDLIEQFQAMHEAMVKTIYLNSRTLLFANIMLMRCERIKVSISNLKDIINNI